MLAPSARGSCCPCAAQAGGQPVRCRFAAPQLLLRHVLEAVQAVADVCGVCRPLLTCDVCGVCRPNTTSYFNAFVTYDYLLSIGMKPWIELGCARPPARLGPVACGGLAGVGAASTLVFFLHRRPWNSCLLSLLCLHRVLSWCFQLHAVLDVGARCRAHGQLLVRASAPPPFPSPHRCV